MKTNLLFLLSFLFAYATGFGQCINNPSIQQGDINPAPLVGTGGGIAQFSFFENLLDYTDEENDPITVTLCLLNIAPVSGAASVAGSFAPTFNWLYDPSSNCLQGTQNKDILGGTGGLISVAFNTSNQVDCPDNQMGYNANLQPAACMNGINETVDDTESVYTCCDGCLIPIELSEFAGLVEDCKGMINWTTQSEVDFSHFELEKSDDGVAFVTLGIIQGQGSPTESASYSYVDSRLSNNFNLYRLRSVDLDGTVAYSKIISLTKGKSCETNDVAFEIYPNPVVGPELTIEMDSKLDKDVTLVITDVLGRVLQETQATLQLGNNILTVNVNRLANATYFVSVKGADIDKEVKKFVKLSN